MEDAFAGLGISLKIDENGVITNFREVEEELLFFLCLKTIIINVFFFLKELKIDQK